MHKFGLIKVFEKKAPRRFRPLWKQLQKPQNAGMRMRRSSVTWVWISRIEIGVRLRLCFSERLAKYQSSR